MVSAADGASAEKAIVCVADASVEVYYNAIKRVQTATAGKFIIYSDGNTDAELRNIKFAHADNTTRGTVGWIGADDKFVIDNAIHGGNISMTVEDACGANVQIFQGNPDGASQIRGTTLVSIEVGSSADMGRFDLNATATNTRMLVYDVDNASLDRVSVGAANSGGTNFKLLRIPN